jgi:hypothetical protein
MVIKMSKEQIQLFFTGLILGMFLGFLGVWLGILINIIKVI